MSQPILLSGPTLGPLHAGISHSLGPVMVVKLQRGVANQLQICLFP